MNRFIFKGPDTQLGRFGMVRKGDPVILTDQEADKIAGDKRFEPIGPEAKTPKPANLIKITDKMTGDERAAAERKNRDEAARVDRLERENSEETVTVIEIRSKSFDELAEIAQGINDNEKRRTIDVQGNTSRPELIRQILAYMRQHPAATAAA